MNHPSQNDVVQTHGQGSVLKDAHQTTLMKVEKNQ